jgi:hypothetical protein
MATFNIRNSTVGQISDSGTNIQINPSFSEQRLTLLRQHTMDMKETVAHSDLCEDHKARACKVLDDVVAATESPSTAKLKLHERLTVAVHVLTVGQKLAEIAGPYVRMLGAWLHVL